VEGEQRVKDSENNEMEKLEPPPHLPPMDGLSAWKKRKKARV
jgi:hypothetical protein